MAAKVFAIVAYVIGLAGAGLFFAFVLGMGAGFWPRTEPIHNELPAWIDLGLLALFSLQHSGMARHVIKDKLGYLGRSIYVGLSGIIIGGLTWFWQPIAGEPVWQGPLWIVGISLLAMLGAAWCSRFDHASFFGLRQAWTGKAEEHGPLIIDGPYRYVRHPLMLGFLIAIWAQPIMQPEMFLLNSGMTMYVLFAIGLEERDLIKTFGEEYVKYRERVPVLIPWTRPRSSR
jgi:protein-S-isoprenylcysteine O-methyltransferase Ste14